MNAADLSRDRVEQIIREAIELSVEAYRKDRHPAAWVATKVRVSLGVTRNVTRFENGLRDQLEAHAHQGPDTAIRAAATWAVEQLQHDGS